MFLTWKILRMFLNAQKNFCFICVCKRLLIVSQFYEKLDYVSYKLFLINHKECVPSSFLGGR